MDTIYLLHKTSSGFVTMQTPTGWPKFCHQRGCSCFFWANNAIGWWIRKAAKIKWNKMKKEVIFAFFLVPVSRRGYQCTPFEKGGRSFREVKYSTLRIFWVQSIHLCGMIHINIKHFNYVSEDVITQFTGLCIRSRNELLHFCRKQKGQENQILFNSSAATSSCW